MTTKIAVNAGLRDLGNTQDLAQHIPQPFTTFQLREFQPTPFPHRDREPPFLREKIAVQRRSRHIPGGQRNTTNQDISTQRVSSFAPVPDLAVRSKRAHPLLRVKIAVLLVTFRGCFHGAIMNSTNRHLSNPLVQALSLAVVRPPCCCSPLRNENCSEGLSFVMTGQVSTAIPSLVLKIAVRRISLSDSYRTPP